MTYVTLTNSNVNSGSPVYLSNADVSYSQKNSIFSKAVPGKFGTTEVHSTGWDNPMINLNIHMNANDLASTATTGSTLTWPIWNKFLQQKPTTSNQTTMTITAGTQDLTMKSYALSSTSTGVSAIPIVINNSTLTFSTKDSDRAHFWTIKALLTESS